MSVTRVVAITGCDSGLGWAIAARTAREGLVTVAGMLNGTDTNAAQALKEFSVQPYPLDVTKAESVLEFSEFVKKLLRENPDYRLYAVVNNAGVMTIGEHEWQTQEMIENTVNINLLGTMRVVSSFLPVLRLTALEGKVKPRIINVASHCGIQPLPGFASYSASKAGVMAFTRALRMEQRRYGLTAVAFIPGGFISASNLIAGQVQRTDAMLANLNEEQLIFYSKRIKTLQEYLRPASVTRESWQSGTQMDPRITTTLMKALTNERPKRVYKVENWRYTVYYFLMRLPLPEFAHCWIVKKFLDFPET